LYTRYPGCRGASRRELGKYPELSLEGARTKARHWKELITRGIDPAKEQERQQNEAARQRENTFASVAQAYIAHIHRQKQRKAKIVERELRNEFIKRWGERPVTSLTARDVVAVTDAAVDRGSPYQAHNLFGHIRTLFGWAIGRGIYGLEHSPCDRLKPKNVI